MGKEEERKRGRLRGKELVCERVRERGGSERET